jgi:glycine/serine hydroxymethyltransferase
MPPVIPSGIRLGTPGITTRGMTEHEMKLIAKWILSVIDHVKDEKIPMDKEERIKFMKSFRANLPKDKFLLRIASEVKSLCKKYPTV